MREIEQELRQAARALLQSGSVACVIGWRNTSFPAQTGPAFINKANDAALLVWNEHCLSLLAKYALAESGAGKVALCARSCELRALNRLIADGQLRREQLFLLGLPCPGMREDGALAAKCLLCAHPNPLDYDLLLGSPAPQRDLPARFKAVEDVEQLSADARYDFWQGAYQRCIRCYACRNACPACHCRACYVESAGGRARPGGAQNAAFLLTRAFHMAGRCVECGECERVCPLGLPLMLLNRKLLKDESELFGVSEHGLSADEAPPWGGFAPNGDDAEEFS